MTHKCPCVRLALYEGPERAYLLHDPQSCPAAASGAVYDRRVHLAYVLAGQGHRPHWLAQFTALPLAAAQRIAEAASPAPRPH
ncbi:hypothetical protein [Streptomyces orinoci]|uniref:Uncharacterized protein n=1 Tax=Streptomyces orinoci TaxID=67339 RepID=A0ABV3K1P8_STRON|nr:hypothetical protein [Streptomyces orinoci]